MNESIRRNARISAALAWLLVPAAMAGAQVCVDPAGGGCQLTIQAGVDVATAGQTVTLAAGTYSETVEIPAGKDGLVISASGAVLDNPTSEDGITILSNDVTIRGLALRNGNTGITVGDDAVSFPSGTVLTGLDFNAVYESCVMLFGVDDTTISGSSFTSCGEVGVRAERGSLDTGSNGTLITKNRFRICGNGCVNVDGDGIVVSGNKVSQSEDDPGILVEGDDARVEKNSLIAVAGGVAVFGARPVVVKNKVSVYSSSAAFEVDCLGDCTGALVSTNKATSGADDEDGFSLYADAAGMVVSKNSTRNAPDDGFDIGGVGITVTGNKSTSSGGDAYQHGFYIEGEGHIVTGNTASGNANDGFNLTGIDHQLTGNTASGNFGDGFDCHDYSNDLTGVVLASNTASDNIGQGFVVTMFGINPIDVTLTGNTSTGNLVAFCEGYADSDATDGGGNSFTIAGAPLCAVDHD